MVEVTESAIENLKAYMQENKMDSALRIALMQGGWAGPSLGLALDEPNENDATYDHDGLKFLVDNSLLSTCGNIKVDFVNAGMRSGFSISSTNPLGGSSCSSSSCGSGGCGWLIKEIRVKSPWFCAKGFFFVVRPGQGHPLSFGGLLDRPSGWTYFFNKTY